MVSQSTAGRISESTTINENDVRLVYLLWESSTQSLDKHLAIFSISKREVTNSSTMSLTDVAAKKTISIRIFVHDVESNCHVREAQRVVSRQTRQRTKNVNMLSASIRSTSEASRKWYCRCQGKSGIEIPRVDDEDLNSSTESINSTSLIHCIASVGNCEKVHTSVLNLIFQQANVAGVGNLSK